VSAAEPSIDAEVDHGLLNPIHDHFTIVPNRLLRYHGISPEAKDILCDWLSHSSRWQLSLAQTADQCHMGYERARRAVKQLRDQGFVHFIKRKAAGGKFAYAYRVANRPVMDCQIQDCQDCAARVSAGESTTAVLVEWERAGSPQSAPLVGSVSAGESTTPKTTAWPGAVISEEHSSEDQRRSPIAPTGGEQNGALFEAQPAASDVDAGAGPPQVLAGFTEFYGIYPRHIGKAKAKRAFATASKTADPQVIIAGARRWAEFCETTRRQMQYIPHPTTWLNQGRWDDDLEEEAASYQADDGPRDVAAW
jgi:predicted transcriptional regulator